MRFLPILAVVGLGLVSTYALANSVADTMVCTPYKSALTGKVIEFPKGKQSLFGINNTSPNTVQLRSINKSGSAQAGWDSQLQSNHWSVIALSTKGVTFTCLQGKKPVSCANVVSICQFSRAEFLTQASAGSYWAAENVTGDNLISSVAKRGIDVDG